MVRYSSYSLLLVLLLFGGCLSKPASTVPAAKVPAADYHWHNPQGASLYYFARARLQAANGDFDEAAASLREAIDRDQHSAFLRISLASLLLQAGQETAALDAAQEALALDPGLVQGHLLLGGIYFRMGQFEQAAAHFGQVAALDPDNEDAVLHQAVALDRLDDRSKAMGLVKAFLAEHPDSVAGRLILARLHRRHGDLDAAEKDYRELIKRHAGLASAYLELGQLYDDQGRLFEAVSLYRQGVHKNPRNLQLRRRLIRHLINQQDLKGALAELQTLSELAPDDLDAKRRIGLILLDQQRWADAAEIFRQLLDADQNNDLFAYYYGSALEREQRWADAYAAFSRIDKDSDRYPDALYHRSFLKHQLGDLDQAIQLIRQRITLAADRPDLFDSLATMLQQAKRPAEAKEVLAKGISRFPKDTTLRYHFGVLLEQQGEWEAAMTAMQKLLQIDPSDAEAMNFIAYGLAEKGTKLDHALELIQRALSEGRLPHMVDTLGWIYFRQGRYPEARDALEEAAGKMPEDPVVLEHLADLYQQIGERQLALKTYLKALKFAPDNDQLKDKLQHLEQTP